MDNVVRYSSKEEYEKAMQSKGLLSSDSESLSNPDIPISEAENGEELSDDEKGQLIAESIREGFIPSFENAMLYRQWRNKQEVNAWQDAGNAFTHTVGELAEGAYELTKDAVTFKPHKVLGSLVEGAGLGTKNWLYMYEEAKYDEHSWLHKMLFDTHANDQEYYWNLKQSIETQKMIKKDAEEGILIPPKITIGGMELDLTNPSVVQAVSYVADASWLMPNLGIESTIAKSLRGLSKSISLGEQLTKASFYANGKLAKAFGGLESVASKTVNTIEKAEGSIVKTLADITGTDAQLTAGGRVLWRDTMFRGAVEPVGLNKPIAVFSPVWALTQSIWGVTKGAEFLAKTSKEAFQLASKSSEIVGMRLSERLAMESESKTVQWLSTGWSKTASPFLSYVKDTTKTALHSSMYGGAFGIVFGGEEGFYNGLGTGFALGGAFHHIGLIHGAVAGSKAIPDTIKNFLWSTSGMDYYNQEGLVHLLDSVEKSDGVNAKLRLMAEISAIERLGRGDRRVYYREETIKRMLSESPEAWAGYEKLLSDPDWGGVAFHKDSTGENYTIINVDRASKSAVKAEFFHTMLLNSRYGSSFIKAGVDALIGTPENKGALFSMPKEDAVRLLESFRDSYLKLDSTTKVASGEQQIKLKKEFDDSINKFKRGEYSEHLSSLFEEFLESYWNRFIEEKPIDYLLNGGDLGVVRNTIELGKSVYRDIMYKDLTSAGANFNWGQNPDHFFIEQNTKQRIRIPALERLMKHYVKEVSKERYKGWKRNATMHNDVGLALTSGLGHNFSTESGNAVLVAGTEQYNASHSNSVISAIDEIQRTIPKQERGLTFTVIGGKDGSEEAFRFSPSKKKKEKPSKEEKKSIIQLEKLRKLAEKAGSKKANIKNEDISELESQTGEPVLEGDSDGIGWRNVVGKDGFWRSEWDGKARIKITGIAGQKELQVLSKWLPKDVVKTFAQLNGVIELSKFQSNSSVSNVLSASVLTKTKEVEYGGKRKVAKGKNFFVGNRTFVPVEINLTFERTRDRVEDGEIFWNVGDAKLVATVIDMDALSTRIDYAWNDLKERGGINYKRVRQLFGSKQNVEIAIRRLLENYSKGQKAEAGAEIFRGEEGSIREARDKRDIINAIIGFHPTKKMLSGGSRLFESSGGHLPMSFQKRTETHALGLPTVMTGFRVDRVSGIKQIPLEGFRYNHDNAYVRSQYNFSPSKFARDHEGNNLNAGIEPILSSSVYRNKEGELMAVYGLEKYNSVRTVNPIEGVHQYVDDSLGDMFDKINPTLRGGSYESESGWLHFTPDGAEAGIHTEQRLVTGYIDTQRHIDISQLDAQSSVVDVVDKLSQRISSLTGEPVASVRNELFNIETDFGTIGDMYRDSVDKTWDSPSVMLESWLFTKNTIPYFKSKGIHSIEYNSLNLLNGNEFSSIAIFNGERFIENRANANNAQNFSFSPSKPLPQILTEKISKSTDIGSLFLDYVINKDGEYVPNLKKITSNDIQRIIDNRFNELVSAQQRVDKAHPFSTAQRQKYIELLTPYVYQSLRKEFPFAPRNILEKITKLSLEGYKIDRAIGKGVGQKLIIRDSLFISEAKRYGITGERIRKTGIPSLGHWAEMTEKEVEMFRIHRQVEEISKRQGEKGVPNLIDYLSRLENREYLEGVLRNNGWSGFINELGDRSRELVFIADSGISRRRPIDSGREVPIVLDTKKLKEYFAIKTNAFVQDTLSKNKLNLKQRSALLDIKKGYEDIMSVKLLESIGNKDSQFQLEQTELQNIYESYTRTIEDIVSQEAKNRIDDMLTAYQIENIDEETVKKVRTGLYDLANRGLVKLGTPEAIQKAVELYAELSQENTRKVIELQNSINRNYINALKSMEQKGFFGVMWSEVRPVSGSTVTHRFPNGAEISGYRMWKWDGSGYYIVENHTSSEQVSGYESISKRLFNKPFDAKTREEVRLNTKQLELYDPKGNLIYTGSYDLNVVKNGKTRLATDSEISNQIAMFKRLCTKVMDDNTVAQSIFSDHFVVSGDAKDFILASLIQDLKEFDPTLLARIGDYKQIESKKAIKLKNESKEILSTQEGFFELGSPFDFSNFDLYSKDGIYLLIRRNDKADTEFTAFDRTFKIVGGKEYTGKNSKTKTTEGGGNFKLITTIVKRAGGTVADRIKKIDEMLKSNVVKENGKTRWLTQEEKIRLIEERADYRAVQYLDTGIVFHFDNKLNIVVPEEGKNLGTIQQRISALKKLRNKGWEHSMFAESIKDIYSKFRTHLEKTVEPKNKKRIERVKSQTKEGNVSKIRTLLSQLNKVEEGWKGHFKEQTDLINAERAKENEPPLSAIEIYQQIKENRKANKQRILDLENKRLILMQRLIEKGLLEGWESRSAEEKASQYERYQMLEENGYVKRLGLLPTFEETTIEWIQNTKNNIFQTEQEIIKATEKEDKFKEIIDTRKKETSQIETKIIFLVDQLSRAYGYKFKQKDLIKFVNKEVLETTLVKDKSGEEIEGLRKTIVNFDKLTEKFFAKKKLSLPEYLPDTEGLTTGKKAGEITSGRPEIIDSVERYTEAFRQGILQVRDRWMNANNKEDLSLSFVLSEGRAYLDAKPDTEVSLSLKSRDIINENNFSPKDLQWISSPENQIIVKELENQWKSNQITESEFIEKLKEKRELSGLDKDSVNLILTSREIARTNDEIGSIYNELSLPSLNISEARKEELNKRLKVLHSRKESLETRKEAIMNLAELGSGAVNVSESFINLIEKEKQIKKNAEVIKRNMDERGKEIEEWRNRWKEDSEKLFQKYDELAKRLGFSSSRIPVKASDVYAHGLMLAFPTLTHDFFVSTPELYWGSTFYGNDGLNSGYTTGSGIGNRGGSEWSSTPANYTLMTEKEVGKYRKVYIADYLHRISQWRDAFFAPENADKPLTAEKALALESVFPELLNNPFYLEKRKAVSNEKIDRVMKLSQGIRDVFVSKNEQDSFIKAFVLEGVSLIYGAREMRESAYKKLKGLSDEQFEKLKAETDPKLFEKMLTSKEIFEQVLYLIAQKTENRIYLEPDSPHNIKFNKKTNTPTSGGKPFLTSKYGLPVETLIRMDGFDRMWEEQTRRLGSSFSDTPLLKKAYEQVPLVDRFSLPTSRVNQIMLENEAGMMQRQTDNVKRRLNEGKPYWGEQFAPEVESELQRIERYINQVNMVDSSFRRFKDNVISFIKNRPKAVREILSVNFDGLAFPNLDFSDKTMGNWRESNDGRFIIKKEGDDKFKVYFIGESVFNAYDGQGGRSKILDIPTTEIGIVSDLDQARILARFFNDDISRVKHACLMVKGGGEFNPWNVLGIPLPATQEGRIIPDTQFMSDYASAIVDLYEKNSGSPDFKEEMLKRFKEIGQYGEPQWISFWTSDGQNPRIESKKIIITPSKEAELSKTHKQGFNDKGEKVWIPIDEQSKTEAQAETQSNKESSADVNTPENPEPTKEDNEMKDVTTFDIISNYPSTENQVFKEWGTLRNKLGYTIIKLKTDNKRNAYRLFNPASGFMGAFWSEQEAVDEILKSKSKENINKL